MKIEEYDALSREWWQDLGSLHGGPRTYNLVGVGLEAQARADAIYSYVGNPFNDYGGNPNSCIGGVGSMPGHRHGNSGCAAGQKLGHGKSGSGSPDFLLLHRWL